MELTINKRLKKYCNSKGLKQYEIAHKVAASTATINNIMTMKGEPSCQVFKGFAYSFPYLNMNWVFRGEGKMELEELPDEGSDIGENVAQLKAMLADKERIIAEKERYIKLLEKTRA